MRRAIVFAALLAVAGAGLGAHVTQRFPDWPQWGGPSRDFVVPAARPVSPWGSGGPPRRWSRPIGDGFAAIVTSGDRGFTTYRDGVADVAMAFHLATGDSTWETRIVAPFNETCSHRLGPVPRATPLITDRWLITASAGGLVTALDTASGRIAWQRELFADSPASLRVCGYSSSPVAHGDNVIVLTGVPGRAVMALRRHDGSVAWQGHDFANGYSSPTIARVGGALELIAMMAQVVVGIDPVTGELRWQHPHPTADHVNVAMPVVGADGLVLLSSGYDGGARVLELTREGDVTRVRQLWEHKRFRVHFGTMVRLNDVVIGSNGDFGPAPLTAVDIKTGKILWRDRVAARASVVLVGDRVMVLDEDGVLVLGAVTPTGLVVEAKTTVLDSQSWTPPTIAGDLLLVRNRTTLAAFSLSLVEPGL
ncbi:MAG TPA: PQQ-binding-like beta-propeller repeat protein [Vicinamibacterales bacterium]|nr:PQQ-binding-like beta-propeller repeat protein [Vicinamibacterales bacterium]